MNPRHSSKPSPGGAHLVRPRSAWHSAASSFVANPQQTARSQRQHRCDTQTHPPSAAMGLAAKTTATIQPRHDALAPCRCLSSCRCGRPSPGGGTSVLSSMLPQRAPCAAFAQSMQPSVHCCAAHSTAPNKIFTAVLNHLSTGPLGRPQPARLAAPQCSLSSRAVWQRGPGAAHWRPL